MSRTFGVGIGSLLVALVSALAVAAAPAAAAGRGPIVLREKGAPKPSNGGNLTDHGGQITPASNTYAIFWGPASSWSTDVVPGIDSLFSGLGGSNLLGIAGQYMRGAAIGSTYAGHVLDPSAPPKRVSASTLATEVQKMYPTLDPSGVYFVYTSNFPSGGGYCAWHSYASVSGQNVAVAYMPNTTGIAGCDPGNLYNLSGSEGLRSLANVTSHEFMESVTDTWPGSGTYAWIDNGNSEIGDKCAWQFGGAVKLSNGSTWQLQEEWSNAVSGCVQGQ